MKWHRKITAAIFQKEEPESKPPKEPRVYVNGCGWGVLQDFSSDGDGYIKFDDGSGQIIRNWNHFLKMVEIIEIEDE